jgi:Uma2 family endonuclease
VDPARRLATYEALLELPEGVRGEIIDGDVIVAPSPLPRHSNVQRALARFIGGPFHDDDGRGGPGGWWILLDVDVRLGRHDIVRPDLVGWRRERLTDPWNQLPIDVVPDWVCEILSPSNAAHDRVKKRKLYATAGVGFYWIVDPVERTLEASRVVDGRWTEVSSHDASSVARIPPFDAVELEVGRLFP